MKARNDPALEALAKSLKTARKVRRLSQQELAEISLVSRTWISYLESANIRAEKVSERTLKLLERALNLHSDALCQFLRQENSGQLAAERQLLLGQTGSLGLSSAPINKHEKRESKRINILEPSVLADPLIGKLVDFLNDRTIPIATKEGLSSLINSSIDLIHTTMESIAIDQLAPQEDEEDE